MSKSINELLAQDLECEGLLECFHGLTALDRRIFEELAEEGDALTVDDLAERVERERSTAYRSVQRLLQAGFIVQEQESYDDGGYCHVYRARPADEITDDLQRMLNDWYAQMGQLIDEFDRKYTDRSDSSETSTE